MGANLTGPARREAAKDAFALAIRRVTYTEIGKRLNIGRNLASTLVQEEQERRWSERDYAARDAEERRSIETYEAVIRGAWQRLNTIHDGSLNVSGLYNVIISAQKAIDDITGVRAPTKHEEDVNVTYQDYSVTTDTEQLFGELQAYLAGQDENRDRQQLVDTDNADAQTS